MAFLKKNQHTEKTEGSGSVLEYLHDVVYILALILVVFTFCVRVVIVSGSSMFSTLVDGDYLLLLNRPLCGELEQGDIVVASMERFKDGEPIVKRVVATEGQTVDIDFRAGIVYVDGVALEEEYIYTPTHLAEGMQFPLTVAPDCVFAMGDNRNSSLDSRCPEIGQIDRREILGRAIFLFLPATDRGHSGPDFTRIGVIR